MNLNVTLFGQMITFLLFVWVTMKFVWPPIVQAMQERQQKIADGLEAAERGKRDLELAKNKSVELLHEGRTEANKLIDQANKRADQMIHEAKQKGSDEGQRMIANAHAEIGQELVSVKKELREEFSNLAIKSASKILEREVDRSAHDQMLNELIAEI